ncbi:signal transduction histidine kinase [Flavobacterium limnosediminis JC2902]|uniref:histidine kinase n=1 Tax=Flavobacterium limnosediminis JC2902 TaxID=1341181 RepID=V6SVK5_9FLAO|nr:PAS domain-containing sensor histidine kinase [Flavobacterium limnosediminis]ESU28470.1 signal transduction histidine kinase [Flavobacterium limnosediminis JC2902]
MSDESRNHNRPTRDTLEIFFNTSPDLFCVASVDGIIEELNPAWETTLGYPQKDLIGKKFIDFVHPDDIETTLIQFKKQLKSKEIINFVYRYKTIDGDYKWLEWKGKINPTDNRIYAIARDITIEKQLESELYQSEENYRTLTESSNDLIMRFDRKYRHLYANHATIPYFGMPPETFIGKTHEDLGFPEAEYAYWDAKIEEVFASGKELKEVVAIKGGETHVDWSLIPEFDNEGKVISVLSYSRDITEIIRVQQALKENENNLKLINAEKDKFFSIIAHDLRSPFNGFLGLTDLLLTDMQSMSIEEIKHFISLMNTSARNLFSLLENLLEWAQMQNGAVKFHPAKINLNEQISFILDTMEESFKAKNLNVSTNLSDIKEIMADKHMLNAIFRNLISNAYKFTPRGGSIEITSEIGPEKTIQITVKDSGIGMNEKMLQNLFSLSEKTNRKGTESEYSSGLGLLLVNEYVDKHNGKISVSSQEGQGSTFTISLPLH